MGEAEKGFGLWESLPTESQSAQEGDKWSSIERWSASTGLDRHVLLMGVFQREGVP